MLVAVESSLSRGWRYFKGYHLRLDFDRTMHTAPGSHGNVHAERGTITGWLARNNPDHSGELNKLHLPVGGARMWACLEDLLQLPVEEFRFDSMPNALQTIEDSRVKWCRRQLAAMVRDDPEEAARVLEDKQQRAALAAVGTPVERDHPATPALLVLCLGYVHHGSNRDRRRQWVSAIPP